MNMLRDSEVQRIPDNVTRIEKLEEILRKHKEYLKNERYLFIKTKSFSFKNALKKKLEAKQESEKFRVKTHGLETEEQMDHSKFENVQSTKNDNKKEEKMNIIGHLKDVKDMMKTMDDYSVENQMKDIIKKHFIETDHNVELELKKYSDESDIIEFFIEKIHMCPEEKLLRIFQAYEERQSKIIEIITKTLLELVPFVKIFTRFFDMLVKNGLPMESFKNTSYNICVGISSNDTLKCENIFLNYGLETLLEAIKSAPVYRSEMCKVIFSLISNNHYSHYDVLQNIRKKFANTDMVLYYHILTQCMTYITEDNLDAAIFEFYESAIIRGINSHCDVIKAKSMYMVTISMIHDQMNSLTHANKIFNHCRSWNWEILSLILIYCSRLLLYYNSSKEDRDKALQMDLDENMKLELAELEERLQEMQKWEETFLKNIDYIFQIHSPNNTLKIGFIYLANILHYYPSLAEKYMKLLIEFNYSSIRQQVLEIEDANLEMEYSDNCLAEKYKICGAPVFWNPIYVAGVFRDYIINNNIPSFDATHLEILYSIVLHQEFNDEDEDKWINFYSDMKRYIFVALSNKDYSNIALNICQKLFTFNKVVPKLLESTFETFISTMKFVYDSGVIEYEGENLISPDNLRILLTFISEIKAHDCQIYIYKLIKTFAIQNNDIYLRSNLLDLMNKISQQERGEIFD